MTNYKKNIFYLLIIFTLLVTSCGYKKIDRLNAKYKYQTISVEGDKRTGYIIKNELMLNSSSTSNNLISITINTDKKKQIKEKNTKNKTTKYEVQVSANIKFFIIEQKKEVEKLFTGSFFYNVEKDHSKSLANEKNEMADLTEILAGDIVDYLNSYFN